MITKRDNTKQVICALDIMGLLTSFMVTYFYYSGTKSVSFIKVVFILLLILLWIMINLNVNACNVNSQTWIRNVFYRLLVAYSLLTSGAIFIVSVFGDFKANYKHILVPLLCSICFSLFFRIVYIISSKFFGNSSNFIKNVIIVGVDQIAQRVCGAVERHYKNGYRIKGIVADLDKKGLPDNIPSSRYLGSIEKLYDIFQAKDINEVIVALPLKAEAQILMVADICEYAGVRCKIVPDYYRLIKSKLVFEEIDEIPLISVRHEPLESLSNRIVKRVFDIIFSAVALIFLSPVLLSISLLIKATSPGDIFFRQKRVGVNNKEFTMYKFRTMVTQPEKKSDSVWTTKNDSRITPIGNFLRKTNLDELPQFWNVFIGNMTVAGPRPERKFFVNQFKDKIPSYKVRHMVKAGLTGWAQVNGWRGDTSIEKRIECDLYYIENWSFWFDIKIIWMTLFGRDTNKNAY